MNVTHHFVSQIWLGVGISIVCVITVLNLLQQYEEKKIVTAADNSDGLSLPRLERPGRQYTVFTCSVIYCRKVTQKKNLTKKLKVFKYVTQLNLKI